MGARLAVWAGFFQAKLPYSVLPPDKAESLRGLPAFTDAAVGQVICGAATFPIVNVNAAGAGVLYLAAHS